MLFLPPLNLLLYSGRRGCRWILTRGRNLDVIFPTSREEAGDRVFSNQEGEIKKVFPLSERVERSLVKYFSITLLTFAKKETSVMSNGVIVPPYTP